MESINYIQPQPKVVFPIEMSQFSHNGSLILNQEHKTIDEAWEIPILLLRWKLRTCLKCDKSFDIGEEGKFYKCGACV